MSHVSYVTQTGHSLGPCNLSACPWQGACVTFMPQAPSGPSAGHAPIPGHEVCLCGCPAAVHIVRLPTTGMATPGVDRRLKYELPKLVESVRTGWLASSQAIAVVGALFAAGETALIPFIKTASVDPDGKPVLPSHAALFKLLLIISYGAFLLNASATISSLILIDKLGEMTFLNRNTADTSVPMSADKLLGKYKLEPDWYRVQFHCLISLLLGCVCIFLQITLYTWLKESMVVFVATTLLAGWCILPVVISISHNVNKAYGSSQ